MDRPGAPSGAAAWLDAGLRLFEFRLPSKLSPVAAYACVGVTAVAAMYLIQVGFYENNVFHIPIVLSFEASAEGPHDAFHGTLARFISLYWLLVRTIATEANLERLFVGLILLNGVLTSLAAYALVLGAGVGRRWAAIGLGIVLFAFTDRFVLRLGGGELIATALTHSQAATAVLIMALALAVRGHWAAAALVCGLSASLNLFLAFWTGGMIVIARLFDGERDPRQALLTTLKLGALIAVPALPIVAWALLTSAPPPADFSFKQYLSEYFGNHNFVHRQKADLAGLLGFFGAVLVALATPVAGRDALRRFRLLLLAGLAVLFLAAVYPYLVENRFLLNLYGLRFTSILYWLAAAGLVAWWAALNADRPDAAGLGAVALVGFMLESPAISTIAIALAVSQGEGRPRWHDLVLALAVLATLAGSALGIVRDAPPAIAAASFAAGCLLAVRPPRGDRWDAGLLALLVAVLAGLSRVPPGVFSVLVAACVALSVLSLRAVWSLRGGAAWRWAATGFAAAAAALALAHWATSAGRDVIVVLAFALALAPMVGAVLARPIVSRLTPGFVLGCLVAALVAVGIGEGARHGFGMARKPIDLAQADMQRWARANTPPGTLFYAPEISMFTAFARRPVWWSWKEGAAVMWDSDFYAPWRSRQRQALAAASLEDIVDLARAQGVAYVILSTSKYPATPPAGVSVVHQNRDYRAFALRP